MEISRITKESKRKTFLIALSIIISIDIWSFKLIPEFVIRLLESILLVSFVVICLYRSSVLKEKLNYSTNVWFFILFPLLSAFGASFFHDQSLGLSFLVLRVVFYWLFYFVLHILNPTMEEVIRAVVFVGIVWGLITVVQQFTYPNAFFYVRQDDEESYYSIYRAGVYRFMINGYHYGIFVVIYAFYQYLIKSRLSYLLLGLFALVSVYVYGTRQITLVAAGCMMLTVFFTKGKPQGRAIAFAALAMVALLFSAEYIIKQYVELSKEQWQYGEDIREVSADFYLFQYWPHWAAIIIGNGPPHELSDYGSEIIMYQRLHIWREDVGIIGALNAFGILHALNIIAVNVKSLKRKLYTPNTRYLLLVVIGLILLLIFRESYVSRVGIPFYCLVFYLIDKSQKSKSESEAIPAEQAIKRKPAFVRSEAV